MLGSTYEREKAKALETPEGAIEWWGAEERAAFEAHDRSLKAFCAALGDVFIDPIGAMPEVLGAWRENPAKAGLTLANSPARYGKLKDGVSPAAGQILVRTLIEDTEASPGSVWRHEEDHNDAIDALGELEEKHPEVYARVTSEWKERPEYVEELLDEVLDYFRRHPRD